MCGLAGFSGYGREEDIVRMTRLLAHRGPDSSGAFNDAEMSLWLGHARLEVLDPTGGHQPMTDKSESIVVVFNGEIYNHRELRKDLEARGHRFRSHHADTEILIHGYKEWGADLPERLNGMFAFAIFDQRRRQLFLSRDRFGEKPLFYAETADAFVFGSEIRSVLAHPSVDDALDRGALKKFFAHGFFPAPHTAWRTVRKLPAGHSMTIDLATRRSNQQRYFSFRIEADQRPAGDIPEKQLVEELRALLDQSVQRRLEADVPLGILLSGGIDSSAILAMAARHRDPATIDAFTIGFEEASFDETAYARQMAEVVGCRHHVSRCDLGEARDLLDPLLARIDEPTGDPSILPTFLLTRFAREQVTVALGGDGGDELFAGYDPMAALGPSQLYSRYVPPPLHRLMRRAVGFLPVSDRNMSFDFKLKRWMRALAHGPQFWLPMWMAPLEPGDIADLFHEPADPEDLYSEALAVWNSSDSPEIVDRSLEYFANFYLPENILPKVDRASMLVSLEVRSPFLDVDLVDFARRLPHAFKFRNGTRKYLLKKALVDLVPDNLLHRPKKGFGMPISPWLRTLQPPQDASIDGLDQTWLTDAWAAHRSKRADHRGGLFCWLSLANAIGRPVTPLPDRHLALVDTG